MDRASQVLAQGVPPGVPNSYRALADHGNVPCSTSIIVLADDARLKRRPKANSTLPYGKRMLSSSSCYKCPILDNQYR
jgi:hypothetical protein